MIAIIVSEKGGSERRELFHDEEVTIGRVVGNHLVLPKGNVSKRHARILFREGRHVVVDLKSTNGTYVNGRRIAQATIVREGDKIYVGDFVLRLEASEDEGLSSEVDTAGKAPPPASRPEFAEGPTSGSPGRPAAMPAPSADPTPSPRREGDGFAPPEGEASRPALRIEPPPRLPSGARVDQGAEPTRRGGPTPADALPAPTLPPPASPSAHGAALGGPPRSLAPPSPAPSRPSLVPAERVRARLFARVAAGVEARLGRDVIERVLVRDAGLSVDAEALARELLLRGEVGEPAPSTEELTALAAAVAREVGGLGALDAALDDADVHTVHAHTFAQVVAVRASGEQALELGFSSREAMTRTLLRLLREAGIDERALSSSFSRRIERGHLLVVAGPEARGGPTFVLSRRRRDASTMDDLVRSGLLARPMATFLTHAVIASANLLVVASDADGEAFVMAALAGAAGPDARLAVLQRGEHTFLVPTQAVELAYEAELEPALRAVASLRPQHTLVPDARAKDVALVLDAISDGLTGVIVGFHGTSLEGACARLPPALAARRAGSSVDAMRAQFAAAFDLALFVARLPDGRHRMAQLAELDDSGGAVVARDVFRFAVERTAAGGAIEGAFAPTGHSPRFVEQASVRGLFGDAAVVRRPPRT